MDSNSLITLMIGFGVVAVLGLVVGWAMWESNKAEATADRHEPAQRVPRYPDLSSPAVTTATVRTVAGSRAAIGTPMSHPSPAAPVPYQQQPQAPQIAVPEPALPPAAGVTEYVFAPVPPAQPVNVAAAVDPAPTAFASPPPSTPQPPPRSEAVNDLPTPAGSYTTPSESFPAPTEGFAAPRETYLPPGETYPATPSSEATAAPAAPAPTAAPASPAAHAPTTPTPPAPAPRMPPSSATEAPASGFTPPYTITPRAPHTTVFRLGRVLWVDDDPDSHVPDVVALHRMGLTVTVARHGEAALAYLAAEKYLLVVTDCGRADDTLTAADFIRTVRRNYPGVPTIAYAPGSVVTGPGAPDLPHDQVVTTPGELPSVVGRLLGR